MDFMQKVWIVNPHLGFYTILTEDIDDVLFPKSSPLIDLVTVF